MTVPIIDLTVCISTYNTRAMLRQCLESVYRHTSGITFEIICIDDNSSDGTAEMVATFFPEVMLIRNSVNQSYARNQNQGLRMSRGRYVCLLDSDAMLVGNAMQALVQFMDEHPDAAACGSKLLNPDGTVQHNIRRFAGAFTFFLQTLNWHKLFPGSRLMKQYYATDVDYSKAQMVESIGTTAYMIRRSTWVQAGMFDERFRWAVADLAYNYVLRQKGFKVYYTPDAEVVHFGSQTINQMVLKGLREQCMALIEFNENYDYLGKSRLAKAVVRCAIMVRYYLKVLGYFVSSDKRVIKGPGAPKNEMAGRTVPAHELTVQPALSLKSGSGAKFDVDRPRQET